nr:hypothetical protein [uncultured Sphingomonas sp.]
MNASELNCRGVKLIPRTAESEREIAAMFGVTDRPVSAVAARGPEAPEVTPGASLGRDGFCRGWTQGFTFKNVRPGDYFLTALGSNQRSSYVPSAEREAFSSRDRLKRDVYFMQPLRVTAADRTIRIEFTED